jgi:hypothetical protein
MAFAAQDWIATLSGLAAEPGPAAAKLVTVAEVDARYEFVVGDSSTANSWTVIAPTGGTAGRWILRSERIYLSPLGAGMDDWPRLIGGACAAMSAVGGMVLMRSGTWQCKSKVPLPNAGVDLVGNDAVLVISSLIDDGQPSTAPFLAQPGSITSSTALAAANVPGSATISSTGSVAVGSLVRIKDSTTGTGFHGGTYTVRGVSGSGPFSVTLDRPVLDSLGAGDPVDVLPSMPTRIRILGNGMRVSGTGTRLLELICARHCLVDQVRFVPDVAMTDDLVASFDLFGYDNEFRQCEVDGGGVGHVGFALESQERSRITRCRAHHLAETGFTVYDSSECTIEMASAWANAFGLSITADGNVIGCRDTLVVGGSYNGNTSTGISIHNGSRSTRLVDVVSRYNATNVHIGDAGSVVSDTVLSGRCDRATTFGVTVASTARGTLLRTVDVSNSKTGLNLGSGADVDLDGITFNGATGAGFFVINSAAKVSARGLHIATSNTGINVVNISGGRFDCAESNISSGSTSNLFKLTAGVLTLSQVVGTGGRYGVHSNTGCTVYVGKGVDMSGCITDYGGTGTYVM